MGRDAALCWAVNEKPAGTKSTLLSCFSKLCVCVCMCVFVSVAGVILHFTYVGRYAHAVLHTCMPHLHTDTVRKDSQRQRPMKTSHKSKLCLSHMLNLAVSSC